MKKRDDLREKLARACFDGGLYPMDEPLPEEWQCARSMSRSTALALLDEVDERLAALPGCDCPKSGCKHDNIMRTVRRKLRQIRDEVKA